MKSRKPILVSIILAVVAAMTMFIVSCGSKDTSTKTYTMSFETYGGTEIEPIKAIGGSMIFVPSDPVKSGSTFEGWYTNAKFSGEAVEIPNIMPNKNITYHAKFDPIKTEYTVTYVYNIGKAPHAADIANVTVEAGQSVTVADGNDYGAIGYMFMGWSIYPNGFVSDVKQDGQYNPGDIITVTDANITLYAQWAAEYTDSRNENDDKIYVYEPLVDKGRGAAKLVRADKTKSNLEGFVASSDNTDSGYAEFSFYSEEFDGGAFEGRLYVNRTYAVSDGMQGQYVYYDYIDDQILYSYFMTVDGFGYAAYIQLVGDMVSVVASGDYMYSDEYGDYTFVYTNTADVDGTKAQTTYFNLSKTEVDGTDFDGVFAFYGYEGGQYAGYYDPYVLELSGYGGATLSIYDDEGKNIEKQIRGVYYGSKGYYESYMGEWEFIPLDSADSEYTFKFIIDYYYISSTQYYPVFYIRDDSLFGTYTAYDENDKSVLYLDGYGMAEYTSNGVAYVGSVKVDDGIVEFTVYVEQNGSMVPSNNVMIFVITGNKFALSTDGFVVNESGVLTTYRGKSSAVEIPEVVTGYTVTEIDADAFNYSQTDVSLVSITVPATVTKIGARAFQNNYTLRRIIFLSEEPVTLDLSSDNNPFRWPAGDFIIVVPQNAVDAYQAAWAIYADRIVGSEDINKIPEFVVEDGVLVRYNKPEDKQDEILDLIIPEEVTSIADSVFLGITGIRSVDLNNVVTVGDYAFYGCADLETVKFTNVESLGAMAFGACAKLNNSGEDDDILTLPAIETVGEYAFSGCESLRLVRLGENLSSIDRCAFYECNVYEADPPLFIELLGENAPTMGDKITLGNISVRIKVQDIKVALNCYKNSTWSAYCSHLYIESGDEKGMYISGDDTLELDGRALYQGSYIWMYAIDGEKITFYEYDSYNLTYNSIIGTYKNEEISFVLGNTTRHFVRVRERMTYTTKDGKYTLECNPMDLQPDSYENYSGYADVKFNGKDVKLYINGYSTKIIYEYEEDGKLYDITITFNGETMEVSKKLSPILYSDITAPDGSKISILFQNGNIYIVTAEFEIEVDTDRKLYWTEASGMGVFAEQKGNVFTFSFRFRSDMYNFTVTVSSDYKTFTYTYSKS